MIWALYESTSCHVYLNWNRMLYRQIYVSLRDKKRISRFWGPQNFWYLKIKCWRFLCELKFINIFLEKKTFRRESSNRFEKKTFNVFTFQLIKSVNYFFRSYFKFKNNAILLIYFIYTS